MSEVKQILDAVNGAFEEFKKADSAALEADRKANEARARELREQAERANAEITELKAKATQAEQDRARIEALEAMLSRPATTKHTDEAKGFYDVLRRGFRANDMKSVSIGTAADGGYAVPEQIATAIEQAVLKLSDVVGAVKQVTASTSDYKELVGLNSTAVAWSTESGTRSETGTSQLRERAPTWGELYAYPKVSNWALEDIFFDVAGWLVNDASTGMAQALSSAIYNGDGSGKITGVFNTAPTTSADYASPLRAATTIQYIPCDSSSPQKIAGDDLIDLVYSLAPGYRGNARFAMSTLTQAHVRKLKDSDGQYLWQPSMQAGQPDRLLGYPVITWENLAAPTTADGYPVVFGDFARGYMLVTRTGMSIDREAFTTPGYTKFYVRRRYGGCVLNCDALKTLKLADT